MTLITQKIKKMLMWSPPVAAGQRNNDVYVRGEEKHFMFCSQDDVMSNNIL